MESSCPFKGEASAHDAFEFSASFNFPIQLNDSFDMDAILAAILAADAADAVVTYSEVTLPEPGMLLGAPGQSPDDLLAEILGDGPVKLFNPAWLNDGLLDDILGEPIPSQVDDGLLNDILDEPLPRVAVEDDDVDELLKDAWIDQEIDAMLATAMTPATPTGVGVVNVTANFLGRRLMETGGYQGSFMRTLRSAVMSNLPVSAAVGMVDDHIQNCFVRLIFRDSLKKRLADGYKVTDQQIAMFAVRAGYTDIRDSGTDPVCRELYGARTEREREKGVVTAPITDPRVVWAGEGDEWAGTWVDIADNSAGPEEAIQFAQIWKLLEDTIRKHKPNAAERYIGILREKVAGHTVNSIADQEGVSAFRASSLMAEIRRVLRMEDLAALGLA